MVISKIKFFSVLPAFLILFTTSCGKQDNFEFPVVYISVSLNVENDAEFISLSQIGNSMEITNHPKGNPTIGYDNNGIIVYNNGGEYEPFYAFDRTCPNNLPESVAVSLDDNKATATCPKCGSVFVLPSEGLPSTGSVSKHALKKYRTYYNQNTGELIISN